MYAGLAASGIAVGVSALFMMRKKPKKRPHEDSGGGEPPEEKEEAVADAESPAEPAHRLFDALLDVRPPPCPTRHPTHAHNTLPKIAQG